MYQPPHHREDRLEVQHDLIRAHPLGLLVTQSAEGPSANPIPFLLDAAASPLGTLQGHLARANPQWRTFDPGVDALVVFQGVEAYITPSWYATKRESGKVVPTWNYAIVQVRGRLRVIDDPTWKQAQVRALTGMMEAARDDPWHVSDAPEAFIEAQLKGIVGLELTIERIEGKWKVSQNRPARDRDSVVAGLSASPDPTAAGMADLIVTHARKP